MTIELAAPERLTLASRESQLAMWQAEHVRDRLAELYPACQIDILGITTEGDRILDRPLADIGGKGLFIKELELAIQDGRADLAVHSMKDVPMEMPAGFELAVIMARDDPRDAFISNKYDSIDKMPNGARLGTSSLRRSSQVLAAHPKLTVQSLRGNINTRLRKLDEGQHDAIILAAAGLKRLGLADRIKSLLTPADCVPSPGQGALGIEIADGRIDLRQWLQPLIDVPTLLTVSCERTLSARLAGSCRVPLAGYCQGIGHGQHELIGRVTAPDGTETYESVQSGLLQTVEDAQRLGGKVADDLLAQGAGRWLDLS